MKSEMENERQRKMETEREIGETEREIKREMERKTE